MLLDPVVVVLLLFVCTAVLLFFLVYPQTGSLSHDTPRSLVAVFGSGGHTKEMLSLLHALPPPRYSPRSYVCASTDSTSIPSAVASGELRRLEEHRIHRIPRAREVGQSYLTAVKGTLLGFVHALRVVHREQPGIVLVNGPGTCMPVCAAAVLLRAVGLVPGSLRVVFVESACRVATLSLSGRMAYSLGLADVVAVQWPQLQALYPRTKYVGLQC